MKRVIWTFVLVLSSAQLAFADVTQSERGKSRAGACSACHGVDGVSVNPVWPNLAGQKRDYLIKQLQAFKSGDRKDPLMSPMAVALSTQDIEDLAVYFSGLNVAQLR